MRLWASQDDWIWGSWTERHLLELQTMTQERAMVGRYYLDICGRRLRFNRVRVLQYSGSSVHVLLIDQ